LVVGSHPHRCSHPPFRPAPDRGYYMTCVHDACAAETEALHQAAISCFKGYCRLLSTTEALALVPGD
jgi:hypothetical protein